MNLLKKLLGISPDKLDCALVIAPIWGIQNPPIGLAYIKSMLLKENYMVTCFDFNIEFYHSSREKIHWDLNYPGFFHETSKFEEAKKRYEKIINKWVDHILNKNPRIIGFSIFQSTALLSLIMASKIKEKNKEVIIFGGGLEINEKYRSQEELNIYFEKGFDYLITRNNNEVVRFVNAIIRKKGFAKNIPGIVYKSKKENSIKYNNKPSNNVNLLVNLIPDYSDFNFSIYKNKDSLPVNFSYGCVNRCTFCIDPHLWNYYACKKGEQMYLEIKHYLDTYPNIKNFQFTDSLINGNHRELEKFCDLVIQNNIKFSWNAKARFDKKLTKSLLEKIKKSGCTNLDFGLESGSQKVLDDMNKNIDLKDVKKILKDCKEVGINTFCFIMIGYPTETEKDFEKTLDFIRENKEYISRVGQTTCCYVVKPSVLYDKREQYKIKGGTTGWRNDIVSPEIRKKRADKLIKLIKEVYGVNHCVQTH